MTVSNIMPSNFKGVQLMDSVFHKAEYEIICNNMITISIRLGDKWGLTKDQYEQERIKDGDYSGTESRYADEVLPYLKSARCLADFNRGLSDMLLDLLSEDNE